MLAAIALVAASWSGPAVMVIFKSTGTEYVQFSSAARCFSAKAFMEEHNHRINEANAQRGLRLIEGTGPRYECIPG